MSDYNSSAVPDFLTAVKNGAAEAIEAFSRAFGLQLQSLEAVKSGGLVVSAIEKGFRTSGLLMIPITTGKGCGILIPKSTGLVPEWCDHPDATGKSKLTTLSQEWGMTLLPEDFFPDDFQAGIVSDLVEAVVQGNIGESPGFVEIEVKTETAAEKILMLWPMNEPMKAYDVPSASTLNIPPPPIPGLNTSGQSTEIGDGFGPFETPSFYETDGSKQLTIDDLPGFTRSLLKVKLPVAAVLAESRRPIKVILELGVGSVIQFDKSCDSLLDLQIGNLTVGKGEAVKIGDKFGLRVHSILLPEERFRQVEVRHEGEYKNRRKTPAIIGKAPIRSMDLQHAQTK
ncbi:MAG: FliM/FliN family flagellar motor switch protein [Planctomycetaceae bacterium]|jgi:flagellar motor switch/type III secretory pathway protein FliN|nr:FliM/FliN family flagellar motor switch protein [Planctomycetaceae bacterium]